MAQSCIAVDLLNPGQVFACLGLMEVADRICGDARAAFDWNRGSAPTFVLRAAGDTPPVEAALRFAVGARVSLLSPPGSGLNAGPWGVATRKPDVGSPFPCPPPDTPASLPAVLSSGEHEVLVSSWGDTRVPGVASTGRDNVKFWGGSKGKPGAQFLAEALALARPRIDEVIEDPFSFSAPQGGSLRFDWRRDYIPLDAGFSLNDHKTSMRSTGYPLVEAFAALGLNHARPQRSHKLRYRYAVLGGGGQGGAGLLPPLFHRTALGAAPLPFPTRTFTMELGWPGQPGQARCITTVTEEIEP